MIDWMQKISGKGTQHNAELEELHQLRKEISRLKKKFAVTEAEEKAESDEEEENDIEENEKFDDEMEKKKSFLKNQDAREAVSAEVYGNFNKKADFKPKVVPKTPEQIKRIQEKVLQSFLFNQLDEKDLNTVINAMEENNFKEGEKVIRQGEKGDVLLLIEKGKLDCFKILKKDEEPTFIKTYLPGEAFGELALLYNAPRAATIIANENCLLWALDRETFNHIVKDAAMKKREKYEKFLRNIEILSNMDGYEITQICDALKREVFDSGDYIIRQNDVGDKFYILEEGEAIATKMMEDNKKEQLVLTYTQGGYFGELSLIKNELRAANVIAKVKKII